MEAGWYSDPALAAWANTALPARQMAVKCTSLRLAMSARGHAEPSPRSEAPVAASRQVWRKMRMARGDSHTDTDLGVQVGGIREQHKGLRDGAWGPKIGVEEARRGCMM